MTTVSLENAQAHLPELLEKVVGGQEIIIITRDDTPLAQLTPVRKSKPQPQFGSCKGMLTIISDDDEHLEHFKEYMP
jgi:prevent-host-death family protein